MQIDAATDARVESANDIAIGSIPRRVVSVLGVTITDVTKQNAFRLLEGLVRDGDGRCHSAFIVNAHTLNVATEQSDYRDILNSADFVFNDGTGVRWAARQRGIELRDNLVGTDLIPEFFHATAGRHYRYFLLGAEPDTIEKAAAVARDRIVGWTQAGYHHGFIQNGQNDDVIGRINASRADVLLVGMGNPIQERWIHGQQRRLRVPLAIGVGGLFDHWIDKPRRAPLWVRRMGCEWVHKLLLQPHKWRRYLLGNPKFLIRIARAKQQDLADMQACNGAALRHCRSESNIVFRETAPMIQHATTLELEPAVMHGSDTHLGGISVVMPAFEGGGAQRDMVLLCNAIAAKGVPITIIILRNEGSLRSLVDPAIPIVEIPGHRIRYAIPGLRRAFRQLKPRFVVGSESNLNLCCLLAARSLPRAVRPRIVLREVGSPSAAQKHDPHWQNRVAYGVLRRMYRTADQVITLTNGARRDLIENFSVPAHKVSAMCSNAVITAEVADRIARWDGEQGREQDLIVSVGRLSPEKNHRLLLQALALLGRNRPWRLALVGDGKERPALEEFVRANGISQQSHFCWLRRRPIRLADAGQSCGLLVHLRRALQRDHRSARLRHAGSLDGLPVRPAGNITKWTVWHPRAARRCCRNGRGDRGGARQSRRPRIFEVSCSQLHRRAHGGQFPRDHCGYLNRSPTT